MKNCTGWCLPLYIYLTFAILSMLGLLTMHSQHHHVYRNDTTPIMGAIVYKLFWAVVIYLLCSNCHVTAAWVILLIPVIFLLLLLYLIFDLMLRNKLIKHY